MLRRRTGVARVIATSIAILALLAAVPQNALAQDKGIWSLWADEVTNRGSAWEIPIAVLVSLPAMIVVTPFWLAKLAADKIEGD